MLDLADTSTGSGELQYLKWINAIGKFSIDGNDNILLDLKGVLIDPESLRTGWGYITRGQAPEWVWDEQLGIRGPEPEAKGPDYGDRFKRGFSLDVFIPDEGWRNWTTNAKGPGIGLNDVWPQVHEQAKKNKGKLAKLAFKGAKDVDPMKIPVFELTGWVDNPEEPAPPVKAEPTPAPSAAKKSDGEWF